MASKKKPTGCPVVCTRAGLRIVLMCPGTSNMVKSRIAASGDQSNLPLLTMLTTCLRFAPLPRPATKLPKHRLSCLTVSGLFRCRVFERSAAINKITTRNTVDFGSACSVVGRPLCRRMPLIEDLRV